jgi:hypothetical protein
MDHNLRNKQESPGTMKSSLCMDPTSMYNWSLKPAIEPHTFAASLLTTEIDNGNTFFHLENAHHMLSAWFEPVLKLMKQLNILQGWNNLLYAAPSTAQVLSQILVTMLLYLQEPVLWILF